MSFRMESAGVSLGDVPLVLWVSVSCFIVILAQSAATSRAYALPVPTWIRHVTPILVDRNLLDHVQTSESKAGELVFDQMLGVC
jgi:K+ transporter